jgi:IS5 family transposase
MILDLVVEAGNPADSHRLLPMLERHIVSMATRHGRRRRDGGFATRSNLAAAKAWGVHDMAFHKKAGLKVEDMVKSNWICRKLATSALASRPASPA